MLTMFDLPLVLLVIFIGEKTKWIVIPPEELQAAADAINPTRPYSQSRSHSARDSQPRSTAVSASGSTHNSQTPSKVTSGRTSASHSRAHSPNSMASSPHHSIRSRQLPLDARGDQAPEQPPRSSEGNSPRAPVDVAAPVPYVQISRDVYGYGNLPPQTPSTQSFVPPPPPPPQPHYPPTLRVNPNHTQQPYASSSVSPYPQPYAHHAPSDRYGPAPAQPLPPGWGPTDHFVYPYGYPPYAQAHPIMYWPGNLPLDLRQDGRTIYPTYPQVHPHQQVAPPGHVLQDDGDPPREGEPTSQPILPPPTMISRPPPPQESDAVAGYRAMGPVSDTGSRLEEAPRGRRDVVFGSIGAPGISKSPSPPLLLSSVSPLQLEGPSEGEKSDRVAMVFSIGIAPGEAGPSHVRSRTRSQPRLSRAENTTDGKGPEPHVGTEVKVIDLTDPEIKWEFGTANRPQDESTQGDEHRPGLLESQSRSLAPAAPPKPTLDVSSLLFGGPLQGSSLSVVAAEPPLAELQPPYPHAQHPIPYVLPQQQIHVPPRSPAQEELHGQVGPSPYPVHHPPPPQSLPSVSTDGFEVKDFGYGFGRTGGTGHGVASPREERFPRDREWDRSRETDRDHHPWRPRRGSYSGHNERGGYTGRRARGANGFGRGGGRGRWGTFRQQQQQQHQHQRHQQQPQQQQQQQQAPPFTVTPPAQAFRPLQPSTPPPRAPPDVGQYIGTTVQQPPYVPGFEAYQAPVPVSYPSQNAGVPGATQGHPLPRPLSNLTFPLDATRYYLLGQLEYYLSAQNLVSDIFLRKRVMFTSHRFYW
jgi:la-related protein 1